MYISRFELRNYKSFYEPKSLDLQPGFNIITGQNNAGKTALLAALSLNFLGSPHRSQRTIPTPGAAMNSISWADLCITGIPAEILRVLQRPTEHNWWIAQPPLQGPFARSMGWTNGGTQDIQRLLEHIFSRETLTFQFKYQAVQNQPGNWIAVRIPTFGLYTWKAKQTTIALRFSK